MSKLTSKLTKKFATAGIAVATVVSLAGGGLMPLAGAATLAELQAQLATLQAQITALGGGSSAVSGLTWTGSLTLGSKGADVTALQDYLKTTGHFTFAGGATGFFGSITQAAVAAWQAANGVSPAAGYFGPISQVKYATKYSVGTPGTPGTPDTALEGDAGSITVDPLSTYTGEEVGEGEEDAGVLAFNVEADEDSDVKITSVQVQFSQNDGGASEDFTDYADSVSVWMGDEMVGEADSSAFTESSDVYTKSISLDGAIIRAGEDEDFWVAVTANDTLDSGDIDTDQFNVGVSRIRFVDGDGVSTTDTFELDVEDEIANDDLERLFDFASFADASGAELNVSLSDNDAVNEAHIINVESGTTDTDDVKILEFNFEADGSDLNITEIPVLFTVDGSTVNESVIIIAARLLLDGEEIGNETVPNGGAVTFEDLDIDLDDGDNLDFMVTVDLQDLTGSLDEGDTVQAELGGAQVDSIEAEDESGEDLDTTNLNGTAIGEASIVYDEGIMVEFVSESAVKTFDGASAFTPTNDQATYIIVVDITASDDDIYVPFDSVFLYDLTSSMDFVESWILDSNGDNDGVDAFKIDRNSTDRFTFTVVLIADENDSAFAKIALTSIGWQAEDDVAGPWTNAYTFNLEEFETGSVFLTGSGN